MTRRNTLRSILINPKAKDITLVYVTLNMSAMDRALVERWQKERWRARFYKMMFFLILSQASS